MMESYPVALLTHDHPREIASGVNYYPAGKRLVLQFSFVDEMYNFFKFG
jgi:hypothetical protein